MFPENDDQFYEHQLTEVRDEGDSYTLSADGLCFGIPKTEDILPRAGDTVRYYGKGFGSTVRGCFIAGMKVFYRTEAEQERLFKEEQAKRKQEKRDTFDKNKDDMDRRVALLPEVFQRRLQRFRDGNPDFRWDFESYELFTCEQAVVFAEALKAKVPAEFASVGDACNAFSKAKWKDQLLMVPGMDDGHSGNTFGCALRLADHYLTLPENVVIEHGAMVPLVGCREYGCTHPDMPAKEEDDND